MVYWSIFYPMNTMYSYFQMLFGDDDAQALVDDYAIIYGITGSLFTVVRAQLRWLRWQRWWHCPWSLRGATPRS